MSKIRVAELRIACDLLRIHSLELLGYHDSGTFDGFDHQATVFCDLSVQNVAADIVAMLEKYQPQVVLTHEPASTRHPDHLHASRATTLAVAIAKIPVKLYYSAHGTEYWDRVRKALIRNGIDTPPPGPLRRSVTDRIDRQVTSSINVIPTLRQKHMALAAHSSQLAKSTAVKVPYDLWPEVFGAEDYIRVNDSTNAPTRESDLFDGIHNIA